MVWQETALHMEAGPILELFLGVFVVRLENLERGVPFQLGNADLEPFVKIDHLFQRVFLDPFFP